MSRTVLVEVITPIVVAIALAAWIIAIYRANRHPAHGKGAEDAQGAGDARRPRPGREVSGGAFSGHGGRQLMPLPGTEPGPVSGQTDADAGEGEG
jgi:hypothetical protein